ncbi:hypothetical protein Ddye_003872 [Dipteronia dyeriana]|uniref:SWI/SNF complex subunit SWI3D n=1 Tax=Dipteronia dyeriana TaxID=168575 RepID=A0AAD9XTU2_9ROSI|nr:hypothetical protein Ddye_032424 [Dipteronia dyeriana]KAK2665298.1 hypothetical protein Ddye_003872 [Dipteronia dyeriana]
MEEKRREAGTQPAASSSVAGGPDSSPSEPASSRRRAGGQKRKANALSAGNASSTPSKRVTREKNLVSHPPIYNHNGPLTRARGPNTLTTSTGGSDFPAHTGGKLEAARDVSKLEAVEELNKVSEAWEALETKIEADFEAIQSRDSNVHVVPNHCGWFSWTKVHHLEEQGVPSFFNGKLEDRTPDMYMEIRNWIMKKFHTNPNTKIESKDLSELEVGCLDARQEVMEFLEYWGLINFHPFSPVDSAAATADCDGAANADGDGEANTDGDTAANAGDGAAKKDPLLEKLYHFEEIQFCPPAAPKPNFISPAVASGLFPESAITEELVKPEGPAVEYHCNSCSADCSRKRYHCQKQADFDLCTDCFNNRKFGSGMSSSDFILMVPGEAAGVSGGKWTDQETLLLLEALELYKENWNEIAEHVATKTKAQCILHFVQMPIEDAFFDLNDDVDANSKETTDPAATHDDNSVPKDVPETSESKTGADEGPSQTSPMEASKPEVASEGKISQETSKPEDENKEKAGEEMSKSEVNSDVKASLETGENIALKALREAFEAVGYLSTPESPHSFAEVGNPAMALAAFLALLVASDITTVSARSSLKSISGNSSAMQLAARHCFILEDAPCYKKEPALSESIVAEMADQDTQKGENSEDRNDKNDTSTSVLAEGDLSNDPSNKKTEDSVPEEKRPSDSSNEKSTEKSHAAKESYDIITSEKVESGDLNDLSNPELPKDNPELSNPPSSVKESGEGTSVSDPSPLVEVPKEVALLPDSSEKVAGQPVTSPSLLEPSQPSNAAKDIDMVSESLPSDNNEPEQPVITNLKGESSHPTEVPMDVDMVPDSLASEVNVPQLIDSITENETGEDQTKDSKEEKLDSKEIEDDHNIDKLKRAAVTALSAAAVKAKLLADQEEDQIQRLSASLIEKQLQKLETKLAFFHDMDSMTLRIRDQLERSKQRLFFERAQIIQARLGLGASSSRPMPSSVPANRIPMNFANSIARPPMGMTSQRPPISRPMGMASLASTPSNPFISTTVAGSSIRPSSQDTLSSVGTK